MRIASGTFSCSTTQRQVGAQRSANLAMRKAHVYFQFCDNGGGQRFGREASTAIANARS
jgi:hypothetical protein